MKREKNIEQKTFDIEKLACKPVSVSVDGVELPIKIGDAIKLHENDIVMRTVMKITIAEDGKAQYLLEWFDESEFKSIWISANELYYIAKNIMRRAKTGF